MSEKTWKPIEIVPDGLVLLFWDGRTVIGYHSGVKGLEWVGLGMTPRNQPTHWMPLPNPPAHTPSSEQARS